MDKLPKNILGIICKYSGLMARIKLSICSKELNRKIGITKLELSNVIKNIKKFDCREDVMRCDECNHLMDNKGSYRCFICKNIVCGVCTIEYLSLAYYEETIINQTDDYFVDDMEKCIDVCHNCVNIEEDDEIQCRRCYSGNNMIFQKCTNCSHTSTKIYCRDCDFNIILYEDKPNEYNSYEFAKECSCKRDNLNETIIEYFTKINKEDN